MRERLEGNKFYSLVGRIATEWAIFEHTIQIHIWSLVGLKYGIGACITSQVGQSGRLMDCLIALLALRAPDDDCLKPIRSFAAQVGNHQRRRNRLVHDPLFFDFSDELTTKALRMEITAVKKLVYGPMEEPIEGLLKFVLEIEALSEELRKVIAAIPLGPWPDNFPIPSFLGTPGLDP